MNYKLIIFDIDGTLADWKTHELLPGVKTWFDAYAPSTNIIGASNQGGVGLRYWMERDRFGEPKKYPTNLDAEEHFAAVQRNLDHEFKVLTCYAYQSKSGRWSPTPPYGVLSDEWNPDWRKPAPGMLLYAMRLFDVAPSETLMVGDSNEDQDAADAAECNFCWADEFFGRKVQGDGFATP